MSVRPFRPEDAPALANLSAACLRAEADFVLNPLWETPPELFAEFARHGIDPEEHMLVDEAGDGSLVGLSGFLRRPGANLAGLLCPVVDARERGQGHGGTLLRAALDHGARNLGLKLVVAGIGTRNRAGYSLLTSQGFRPVRQHFLMHCEAPPEPAPPPLADVVFEDATAGDAEAIHAIYEACGFEARTSEQMAGIIADAGHTHAVARHGGRVIAFAEIETHWPARVWVAFVGVAPELRARGLGSALTAWAVRQRFEAGAKQALLMLSPANRTAFRAYEKVGFHRHRTFDVLERGL